MLFSAADRCLRKHVDLQPRNFALLLIAADRRNHARPMAEDEYVRTKFTLTLDAARRMVREYFAEFPKDRSDTEVESWRNIQSSIEFVMKRLREPKS